MTNSRSPVDKYITGSDTPDGNNMSRLVYSRANRLNKSHFCSYLGDNQAFNMRRRLARFKNAVSII